MPVNGFTVGRDISLVITDASGSPLNFSLLTEFKSKPTITEQKVKGLDGITRFVRFPDGWQGSFTIERQDSTIDDYFAQLETNYYTGVNETSANIMETISNPDGSTSQYKFSGVMLKLEDAGDYAGDKVVKQSVSFVASRKDKV